MQSVKKLVECLQSVVGGWATEANQKSQVVRRERKFSAGTLAMTFVFGFLRNARASARDLAQTAAAIGVEVTEQAIEKRYTPALATFLRETFMQAVQSQVSSERVLAPLLERFTDVLLLDSTGISLPPELAEEFPGCGGSAGAAALKVQVRISLKTGALDAVQVEAGRDCDVKTSLQNDAPLAGSLRIADLGYFDTSVMERHNQQGAYWLSPLMVGTNIYDREGRKLDLRAWFEEHGPVIDQEVFVGVLKVPARLIAWRLPEEAVNRRRQRVLEGCRRKRRTPSKERLARCEWATLVTNVPVGKLSINEARVLYRARWQIELLFKRWKSLGRVDELTGSVTRKLVQLWGRLLAAVVQQWLQAGTVWGRPEVSLKKAWDTISGFAMQIATSLTNSDLLRAVLEQLERVMRVTVRRNKRRKAGTFELLNDPSKLPYALS
jgi:hypothetical protein